MLAALPLLRRSLLPCLLLRNVPVFAALVNFTIDDTIGDSRTGLIPTYSPSDKWSLGQQCQGCNIHSGNTSDTVNVQQVFDGTWHDSTYHPGDLEHTVAVTFVGSAVYVYNIIANQVQYTTTLTNLTFWIDGDLVGNYIHIPENTTAVFEYNALVYSNTSLVDKQHFLTMSAGGPNASLILFDRIMYTQDSNDASPTVLTSSNSTVPISFSSSTASLLATPAPDTSGSKSSPPVGAIVGGVIGGVVGLILFGLLAFCIVRARRRRPPPAAEKIDPFVFGGARRPPGQRMSRAPILPDLRFGRSHLISRGPGSTAATTDASSSTETGDGFQGHRPRLPPMSPAETARSLEQVEYMTRIQALEAQVRALEVQQQLSPSSDASGSRTQLSQGSTHTGRTRRSRSRGRSGRSGRSANASTANLRSELASLRTEIAALRGELSQDQLGVLEAAPSYMA